MFLLCTSFDYQPQIREPFTDYRVEQQYYQAPSKAATDWDNLDYDDPTWGWLYKQLWYLYHPNSGETPPWLIPVVPIENDLTPLIFLWCLFVLYNIYKRKNNKKVA